MNWTEDIPAERLIGTYTTGTPGPLVLIIAGVQGEDVADAHPVRAFLDLLQSQDVRIHGTVLALAGNSLHASELMELIGLTQRLSRHHAEICFVDLHTTAVPTIPYLNISAHDASLQLASLFPLHSVTGLQRSNPGCFHEYCNLQGFRGFAFESGQHRSASAFSNQIALLWLLLVFAGALARKDVRNFSRYERMLALDSAPERRTFKLTSHYRSSADDDFVMQRGLRNFDYVRKDCCIASNRHGAVLAPVDGFLLLPLDHRNEHGHADKGFFLLEEASANDEELPPVQTALRHSRTFS
ncbi:MAG: hypothetical protein V4603_10935 [Pseudomonadota bacterium]